MKTLMTFLLTAAFVLSINGQTDPGKILLGGSSDLSGLYSVNKWKDDDGSGTYDKGTTISFNPQIGVFVANGLAIGLQIGITYGTSKDEEDDDKFTSTLLMGAPFLRYYFNVPKVKPYIQGYGGAGRWSAKDETSFDTETYKGTIILYGFSAGIGIFLNDNVTLDLGLGYSSMIDKETEDNPDNHKFISNDIGLTIGVIAVL